MRRRHSTGYVRKQRGKWIGAWYVDGKRTSKSLGLAKDLTKGDAKEKLAELIRRSHQAGEITLFGPFVEGPYFDFYGRKWKASTAENNRQRIRTHLVAAFNDRALGSFKRDELQDFLDSKGGLSFSISAVQIRRVCLSRVLDQKGILLTSGSLTDQVGGSTRLEWHSTAVKTPGRLRPPS